jgi:DUF3011 family protein
MQRRTKFAAAGLLAVGVSLTLSIPAAAQGYPDATAPQLRACRTEADRRLPDYSYDQIQVESESRDQNVANVRWWAGNEGGRCTVATNGRVLAFTRDNNYGGGGGVGGGNGYAGTSTRLTCESRGTKRQECPIPAGARIRLVRQISVNECRSNDTYGQGQGYLWVAEGCRGEFEVTTPGQGGGGPGGPGGVTRITCASPINGRQECPIPAGTVARFVAQASNLPCRPNDTYGTKLGAVWVQRGCQAIFELTSRPGGGGNGSYTTRIVCESSGGARQQCPIAGATQIRLVRQISTNPCRLNQTFGMGFGHIWVSTGCRGEFEVTVGGSPGYPGPGTGTPDRVTCESSNGLRTECRIRNGAQVQLVRQLSTAACVRNNTWGTGVGVLWVNKGCRGEFEVR